MFSRYELSGTDTSHLSEEQLSFLKGLERDYHSRVMSSSHQQVKNGNELIFVGISLPSINDSVDYKGVINISNTIVVARVKPELCGAQTFVAFGDRREQAHINYMTEGSNSVFLSADTSDDTVSMVVSILDAKWRAVREYNLDITKRLLAAYLQNESACVDDQR